MHWVNIGLPAYFVYLGGFVLFFSLLILWNSEKSVHVNEIGLTCQGILWSLLSCYVIAFFPHTYSLKKEKDNSIV